MHPEQIKAAIRMKGQTASYIADKLGITRTTVSLVINGRGVSDRVQNEISKVVGIPVKTLWPTERPQLRRYKAKAETV